MPACLPACPHPTRAHSLDPFFLLLSAALEPAARRASPCPPPSLPPSLPPQLSQWARARLRLALGGAALPPPDARLRRGGLAAAQGDAVRDAPVRPPARRSVARHGSRGLAETGRPHAPPDGRVGALFSWPGAPGCRAEADRSAVGRARREARGGRGAEPPPPIGAQLAAALRRERDPVAASLAASFAGVARPTVRMWREGGREEGARLPAGVGPAGVESCASRARCSPAGEGGWRPEGGWRRSRALWALPPAGSGVQRCAPCAVRGRACCEAYSLAGVGRRERGEAYGVASCCVCMVGGCGDAPRFCGGVCLNAGVRGVPPGAPTSASGPSAPRPGGHICLLADPGPPPMDGASHRPAGALPSQLPACFPRCPRGQSLCVSSV